MGWRNRVAGLGAVIASALLGGGVGHAAVTISAAPTLNIVCSGGVCTPTAHEAVLNAADLETMLSASSVALSTTGSGLEAKDILLQSDLAWSGPAGLQLQAYRSIEVSGTVTVSGPGALSFAISHSSQIGVPSKVGALLFPGSGRVVFKNNASQLSVNGTAFTLLRSLPALAAAIAGNPGGSFALQDDYDATGDGVYPFSPISTILTGKVEGLGNSISNLKIRYTGKAQQFIGLFSGANSGASINNLRVTHADIRMPNHKGFVGVLLGYSAASLTDDRAAGVIVAGRATAGGLVGNLGAQVSFSSAHVDVTAPLAGGLIGFSHNYVVDCSASGVVTADKRPNSGFAGGLVGMGGNIIQSYATGKVRASQSYSNIGGLVGDAGGVVDSYATGNFHIGRAGTTQAFEAGGLTGEIEGGGFINNSYSTGTVTSGPAFRFGGFLGAGDLRSSGNDYWDTTTSGTTNSYPGGNVPMITGLTTAQLTAGLPPGFDPKVWAEAPGINNGLPYLINNPPLP